MDRHPSIVVCSREGAEELLASQAFVGVISIRDPGSPRIRGLGIDPALELEFEDALAPSPDCEAPPTEGHVRRVVEYGLTLRDREGTVLVPIAGGPSDGLSVMK